MNFLRKPFTYSFFRAAFAIVLINVAVHFGLGFLGFNKNFFALNVVGFVYNHYLWQVFTYMFVHGDLSHLFFNMLALLIFGTAIEKAIGSKEFLLMYFVIGVCSGLFSLGVYYGFGRFLMANQIQPWTFYISLIGASGAIYATRTAMYLKKFGHSVSLIVTSPGRDVVKFEGQESLYGFADKVYDVDDFFAECASGSADYAGMAVVPCSMGTLGRIAAGTSDNLLVRTADVCLKERRSLVIVPREMPYNLIHIENMARVTRAGAVVIPASPQFYSKPASIEELVDTVVAKVLKHLGAVSVEDCAEIVKPWKGDNGVDCGPESALGGPVC